jgi:hypothetical protein
MGTFEVRPSKHAVAQVDFFQVTPTQISGFEIRPLPVLSPGIQPSSMGFEDLAQVHHVDLPTPDDRLAEK